MNNTHENSLLAFGKSVRAAREKLNFSQEELAEKAGLHRTYISGIEHGNRNVSLTNLFRISAALDLTPGKLTDQAFSLHGGHHAE